MVSDDDIEKALMWLVSNAKPAAQARADRIYLEEYRKTLKSKLMRLSDQSSAAMQERDAYANDDYAKHLVALKEAIYQDEHHRWLMTAAEAKIEAWRTLNANARAGAKIG